MSFSWVDVIIAEIHMAVPHIYHIKFSMIHMNGCPSKLEELLCCGRIGDYNGSVLTSANYSLAVPSSADIPIGKITQVLKNTFQGFIL